MSRAARILFLADAGPAVGGGHVMRCLTLARALTARGGDCAFLATPEVRAVLQRFGPDMRMVEAPDAFARDWLVVDHYRLSLDEERALRAPGRRLMAIDDLADRPREADLLLDPGYGHTAEDFRGLLPEGCPVLAGPAYALVRPEFAALREQAVGRRGGAVGKVLVSLGLTDVGGITGRVVQALRPVLGERRLEVAAGAGAPSLAALRALDDAGVRLHVDVQDMAALTAEADLAIGAGGSSVWERATLGLPGLTLILADNQRAMALRMAAAGLTVAVDAASERFEADLIGAVARLAEDADLRAAMSAQLAALCDGHGAERAAQALLA